MRKIKLLGMATVIGTLAVASVGCSSLFNDGGYTEIDNSFSQSYYSDYSNDEESSQSAVDRFWESIRKKQTEKSTEESTNKTNATNTTDNSSNKVTNVVNADTRKPNFKATTYNYTNVSFKWGSYSRNSTWTWDYPAWNEMYEHYSSLDRYYQPADYHYYINDAWNASICKSLATSIVNTAKASGYSDREALFELVAFVQSIPYQYDKDSKAQAADYPKYPIETLMEGAGDCEDSSILLATMLKELGYGVAIIYYPGHIMVGIAGADNEVGTHFTVDGVKYFVMETTVYGWKWGQLSNKYEGESAYVYVVK